jgi:O-antigen biosynthesis protein
VNAPTAAKPAGYYALERADVVEELPQPVGRTLDVGCGEGNVGRALKAAGATEVWGIEPVPAAAEVARRTLDGVIAATVEDALAELRGPFDTICCYDVLEHLVDPEATLRELLRFAAPRGRLHVSIPNARHYTLLRDLLLRGTFGYTESGHRDTTHLRWYTRRDLETMVGRAGWEVQWVRRPVFRGRDRTVERLSRGRLTEFIALQWHLLALAP